MSDNVNWSEAPKPPPGQDFFWIDYRYCIEQINNVDTISSRANIKIAVCFYWTDSRMIGYTGQNLPEDIWGPWFACYQSTPDLNQYSRAFALVDPAVGRLKRTVCLEGDIINSMNVRKFPYDLDDITLDMWTASSYRTNDGSLSSTLAKGRNYDLREMSPKLGEGKWISMTVKELPEWDILGVATKTKSTPALGDTGGQLTSDFSLRIQVARKTSYYMWKAIVPVWLLALLSMKTYTYPVEELGDRDAYISTLVLATFAMTYVTAGFLPKTDFLTAVDKVTIVGFVSQFLIAFSNSFLYLWKFYFPGHEETIRWVNLAFAIVSVVLMVWASLVYLLPNCLKARKIKNAVAKLKNQNVDGYCFNSLSSLTPRTDSENSEVSILLRYRRGQIQIHQVGQM